MIHQYSVRYLYVWVDKLNLVLKWLFWLRWRGIKYQVTNFSSLSFFLFVLCLRWLQASRPNSSTSVCCPRTLLIPFWSWLRMSSDGVQVSQRSSRVCIYPNFQVPYNRSESGIIACTYWFSFLTLVQYEPRWVRDRHMYTSILISINCNNYTIRGPMSQRSSHVHISPHFYHL